MKEGENLTKFERFCQQIDEEKEQARRWSWFILIEAVKGTEISKIQLDACKEILDRTEGRAVQKQVISGDENSLPVIIKVIKDEGESIQTSSETMGSV